MDAEKYNKMLETLNDWYRDYNDTELTDLLPSPPSRFIHYTTLIGFNAMLNDYIYYGQKRIIFFPSQIQYLNDAQEFIEGKGIIDKNSSAEQKRVDDTLVSNDAFAVCFCGKEDLLSQWKYYGKNCGISIEFDFSDELLFQWGDNNAWFLKPHPVFYDKKGSIYAQLINLLKRSSISINDLNNIFIPYCKNKSFKEEEESRIIFFPINDESTTKKKHTSIEYRVCENKIVPQFKCYAQYPTDSGFKGLPIKNIMIGPGYNQIIIFNAIINMMERGNCPTGFMDQHYIDNRKELSIIDNSVKEGEVVRLISNGSIYPTYKTTMGFTIQMSATPFRS